MITGWEDTQWDARDQQKQMARRGWKRMPSSNRLDIPISSLKRMAIFRENDLYDFARLWTELRALSDEKNRMPGVVSTTHMSVHGLALAFASFIDSSHCDLPTIRAAIDKAAFPLEATIVEDE